MDFIKFNTALGRAASAQRFNIIDFTGDLSDPRKTGVFPSLSDCKFAKPSLDRNENIRFVLSNCLENTSLLVSLKFRPDKAENSKLVTLVADLKLHFSDKVYTYHETETYALVDDNEPVSQYGSHGSAFKLVTYIAYRSLRLVFRGYMKDAETGTEKLVKFSFISCPTSLMYDFLADFNIEAFKESYHRNKLTKPVSEVAQKLYFQDKHEMHMRFSGELVLDGAKSILTLWGYFSKAFVGKDLQSVSSKHIRAHMRNGQSFHLLQKKKDKDQLDLGYVCFKISPPLDAIEKVPQIDWSLIDNTTKELKFDVSGHGLQLSCELKHRRHNFAPIFDCELGGVQGWLCVTFDEEVDNQQEIEEITACLHDHKQRLANGLAYEPKLSLEDDMDKKPLAVAIDDSLCTQSDLVGAKSASLAELKKLSSHLPDHPYQVTGGIVLTKFAYDAYLEANTKLTDLIGKLDQDLGLDRLSETELRESCKTLIDAFVNSQMPAQVAQELENKLKETYADYQERSFAVRSSSWGEDGQEMSAAGQLTTELNVKGVQNILDKVKVCFGSKFSYENVQYKKAHGLSASLPMAVAIQEMVSCEKAGVLFTSDIVDTRQSIITANYGLGESVVSAQAEPDQIKVRFDSDALNAGAIIAESIVGSKIVIISENNQNNDNYDRSKCCLSDDEIIRLAKTCRHIAHYFGSPRDIEWGFKDNQLFLFQSRPITNSDIMTKTEILREGDRMTRAEIEFATRANVGEVMPYPITPLTATLLVRPWGVFGCRASVKYDKPSKELHPDAPYDFICGGYHSYFGLRCSQIFPLVPPGVEKPLLLRSMEISFFGHELEPMPEIAEASKNIPPGVQRFQGPKFLIKTLDLSLTPMRIVTRERSRLKWAKNQILQDKQLVRKLTGNKLQDTYNYIWDMQNIGTNSWQNHLNVVFHNNRVNFGLQMYLSQFIKEPAQLFSALNKFLSAPEVLSGEIPKRIARIAEMIHLRGPQQVESFLAMNDQEALKYLTESDGIISEEYEKFMDKFGHRCYNEFEVQQDTWADDQISIVKMIKLNCKTSETGHEINKKMTSNEEIIKSLGLNLTLSQKLTIHFMAKRSQMFVRTREQSKDILIQFCGVIRLSVRKLAKEFKRQLRLPDEDLIYYINCSEIEPLIEKPQPGIVSRALYRRTMHKKLFENKWNFDEIIRGHDLAPVADSQLDETIKNAPKLFGTSASFGQAKGKVCIVNSLAELSKVEPGDILVTHNTDIGFSPAFPLISGLITEMGGMISHGAVVAREYGLPCLLGILNATKILEHGEQILLDADNGQIVRLDKQAQD